MSDTILKTEVKLSQEAVQDIVAGEAMKVLSEVPGFIETLAREVLFTRPPKRYSYDPDKPTTFERVIKEILVPMIEEEVKKLAHDFKPRLSEILSEAFNANIDTEDFAERLMERLAKFTASISFYVKD